MKNAVVLTLALAASLPCATALASVVVYPDYPEAIPRDYAYAVRVCQGQEKRAVTVYNRTERSHCGGRTRGGDVNRRFCEFAFDGGEVRVDIRVTEDVKSYAVFPSRLGLRHQFRNGVISVWLARPANFGIRLNDYDKSILSVFADAPERDAPRKGAPGVLYVDGWVDAPGRDGAMELGEDIREVYVAPGAVLNARLVVKGRKTLVHGRGMVLDPLSDIFRFDQTANTKRGLLTVRAPGVVVRDLKLIDARTFNYLIFASDVRFENVKALAAMMCSDGFTVGGRGFVCNGAWLYVGDNALVLSGAKGFVISNAVLGTSCAAIFPQFSVSGRLVDTDVFRTDDGLLNNTYNGTLNRGNKWNELNGAAAKAETGPQALAHQTCDLVLERTSCVDCTRLTHLFRGANVGTLEKKYLFDGLSAPTPRGGRSGRYLFVRHDSKRWLDTENYLLTFSGLFFDGQPVAAIPSEKIENPERMSVAVKRVAPPSGLPLAANRAEVNWTNPCKVYSGEALVRDWRKIDRAAGERRLPPPDADTNLVREIWPRQSVWQRTPSWMVKLETENGTDPGKRVYRLVQCEKGAGMAAIVTDEALALGKGRYRLVFEGRAETEDGGEVALEALVSSNDWAKNVKVSVGADWTSCSADFDVPIELPRDDLVAVMILTDNRAVDVLRLRNIRFARIGP